MERSRAFMFGMAAVAESAASPMPVGVRADGVLEALREVVPYDCAALSLWDPAAACYRPLANAGYSARIHTRLHDPEYRAEHVRLGMLDHRRPLCFRDLACGGASVPSITEMAWPEGFREGLGLALFADDGRSVGYLSLNTTTPRHPTDRERDVIGLLGPTLAAVADVAGSLAARLGPEPTVAIGATDAPLALPGREPSALLDATAEPLGLARRLVASGTTSSAFLWRASRHERWHRLTIEPCRESELPGYSALVSVCGEIEAYDLTGRELEVLTLMSRGWSNAAIADHLFNSPRTVSTHVERILDKLGAATRAEAAVRAVTERLFVWVGDVPPPTAARD